MKNTGSVVRRRAAMTLRHLLGLSGALIGGAALLACHDTSGDSSPARATEIVRSALEDSEIDPCAGRPLCDAVCYKEASCNTTCNYISQDAEGNKSCITTNCLSGGNSAAAGLPCDNSDPEPKYPPPAGVSSGSGSGLAPLECAPGEFGVALYQHADFTGPCKMVSTAWPNDFAANVSQVGFPNDALTSLWVGSKVSVQLYFNNDLNGLMADYRPNTGIRNIGGGFNDQMSSFRIRVEDDPVSVRNRSFERPQQPIGGFQYQPSGASWNFSPFAGVAANGSGFTSGNPPAPVGRQVGFIQGQSEVWQTVERFLPGKVYTVIMSGAQRANFTQPLQTVRVMLGDVNLGNFTPAGTSYQSFASPFTLTATSTRHVLKITGLTNADSTIFLDMVRVLGPF